MSPQTAKQQTVDNQQGNRHIQKKTEVTQSSSKAHISNVEWGLVIGALAVIDIIQVLLDLAAQFGVVANRFIDIGVGLALPFYLQIRGQDLGNMKRLSSLVIAFFAEEIPDIDALPFWFLEGFYLMFLAKAEEKFEENEVGRKILYVGGRMSQVRPKQAATPPALPKTPPPLPQKNPSNSPLNPRNQYTPSVAEMQKSNTNNANLPPKTNLNGKVVDFEAAKKRLDQYKQ